MSHGECPHPDDHEFAYKEEHNRLCSAVVVAPEKALPAVRHCIASTPDLSSAPLCSVHFAALSRDAQCKR